MSKLNPNAGEFVPSFGTAPAAPVVVPVTKRNSSKNLPPPKKDGAKKSKKGKIVYSAEFLKKFQSMCVVPKSDLPDMRILEDANVRRKGKQKKVRDKKNRLKGADINSYQYPRDFYSGMSDLAGNSEEIKQTDNPEEEARKAAERTNSLLNELSGENFTTIVDTFGDVEVTCTTTLHTIIGVIFGRAMSEPIFCDLYAKLCTSLSEKLPEFKDGARTINFRRVLLTKCYEALVTEPETEILQSSFTNEAKLSSDEKDSSGEEGAFRRRQYMLRNVVFIGELFRRQLLTENIMHMCISMMLDSDESVSPEVLEAACRLILLVGDLLDGSSPASRRTMNEYFEVLQRWSVAPLEPRIKALVCETIELRANGWVRRKKEPAAVFAHPSIEHGESSACISDVSKAKPLIAPEGINDNDKSAPVRSNSAAGPNGHDVPLPIHRSNTSYPPKTTNKTKKNEESRQKVNEEKKSNDGHGTEFDGSIDCPMSSVSILENDNAQQHPHRHRTKSNSSKDSVSKKNPSS